MCVDKIYSLMDGIDESMVEGYEDMQVYLKNTLDFIEARKATDERYQ